ncbi:hypothetical protein QO259_10420 [Salinicola sp. JS01]|uniref:phage tail terminator protein n=1 Tax=Salinicola sp. JS01 TaxID=3050071 RepID=UPI00255BA7DF|nr:hypothetical protein [Salinicola sp. JS01]WIX31249.1 hypothetical protein QO259_10420 [Salinicola sp. JS01]
MLLSLEPWKQHLAGAVTAEITLAADLESARKNQALPSVTLVNGRERVSHADRHPHVRHRVSTEVMLVTGVARYGSSQFGTGKDQLAELREPLLERLIHWIPPGAELAVRWNGGQILTLTSAALYWVDVLSTVYWWGDST